VKYESKSLLLPYSASILQGIRSEQFMPQFVENVQELRKRAIQRIEEGPVTSTYELDKDKAVGLLNEALATEIVCVLRYMHHYLMATGVHAFSIRDEFKEHADAEREHADRIADRIQELGGVPDFNPGTLVQRSATQYVEGENLADMIREDLIAERIVIDVYRDLIRFFGEKDPTTRTMFEEILADEEEHANDLTDLLFITNPTTGETEGEDPGTEIYGRVRQGRGAPTRSESKPAQGQQQVRQDREETEPAHQPGTTGRTMNRRGRNEADTEDELAAGAGQSGGNRSEKITRPNRKKRVA
jgi:bacterioferritin